MHRSLTQNHLVTLLLDDVKPAEKLAMLDVVNNDWTLKESYKELKLGLQSMPKVVFRPSQKSLDNILRYSKTSLVEA